MEIEVKGREGESDNERKRGKEVEAERVLAVLVGIEQELREFEMVLSRQLKNLSKFISNAAAHRILSNGQDYLPPPSELEYEFKIIYTSTLQSIEIVKETNIAILNSINMNERSASASLPVSNIDLSHIYEITIPQLKEVLRSCNSFVASMNIVIENSSICDTVKISHDRQFYFICE